MTRLQKQKLTYLCVENWVNILHNSIVSDPYECTCAFSMNIAWSILWCIRYIYIWCPNGYQRADPNDFFAYSDWSNDHKRKVFHPSEKDNGHQKRKYYWLFVVRLVYKWLTCSRRCKIKYEARLNFLSQSGHCTVLPVCKVLWVFKMVFCEKRLWHTLHSYGFSPVCNQKQKKKSNVNRLHLPTYYGGNKIKQIPTWIRLWHFKVFPWAKVSPHSLHLYGLSPV